MADNKKSNVEKIDSTIFIAFIFAIVAVLGIVIGTKYISTGGNNVSENEAEEELQTYTMTEEEFLATWEDNDSDFTNIQPGDVVCFGRYEQDGSKYDYLEVIEWDVLAVSDNAALLISKNVLDEQPFHTAVEFVTWRTCSLRQWMNTDFYNSAFTDAERARIKTVSNNNPDSFAYFTPFYAEYGINVGTVGCEPSEDKIFALSYEEVIEYYNLSPGDGPMGYVSEKLVAGVPEALPMHDKGYSIWWLRSPGETLYGYMIVSHDYIQAIGNLDDDAGVGVRPAMWVTIE